MADQEQLYILKQGVEAWNKWRRENPSTDIDLREADLSKANLRGLSIREARLDGANLSEADLSGAFFDKVWLDEADLSRAILAKATLSRTPLRGANLTEAHFAEANLMPGVNLTGANLSGAHLRQARLGALGLTGTNLTGANLNEAVFSGTTLSGADLSKAILSGTVFANADLGGCESLKSCVHAGPSIIDIRTLERSGPLPLVFLRGIGLPEKLINYLPSLLGSAIEFYSCFISYSAKDEEFARRLHADLQDNGVRCWFAPEDMKIGAKIRDTIDEAIRLRDKVLIVLSEAAIASDWVEDEVDKAFEEERQRGGVVLFPVRVDDAVMETHEAWAAKLRRSRHMGDFRVWKEHDSYQKAFQRVLRDLRVEATDAAASSVERKP